MSAAKSGTIAPTTVASPVSAPAASRGATPSALFARGAVLQSRIATAAVGVWAVVVTTVLVWVVSRGGPGGAWRLLHAPGLLFTSSAADAWILGGAGAFLVFLTAFVLCQLVGRGLLKFLQPTPLPWPDRLPRPVAPFKLLAYRSEQPDAFAFTLLARPTRSRRGWREEMILVSESLLRSLTPEEWEAVVAHELGHVRALDVRYLTFFRTFARMVRWDPVLAVLADRLTRREEFGADRAAVELTGRPRALARAIFKASLRPGSTPGALAGLLGPGGRRGRRQAFERIRRLVELAESGRFPEDRVA